MAAEVCNAMGCFRPVALPGERYCDRCGCAWCHGNAAGDGSFGDNLGRAWCGDACNNHYWKFHRAEAVEA
jgi:hypothetical protein